MADVSLEIDDQLRAERVQRLLRRGWPFAAGLAAVAAVVALAAWGLSQHELSQSAKASEQYADAGAMLVHGDLAGADRRFGDLSRSGPRVYRALALMQQAGIAEKRHSLPTAVGQLDQAAQVAPNLILADAARLEAAYAAMDQASYADVRARLLPLAQPGRPYRSLAREALGMIELASGRVAEARGDLQVVSLASDASDAERARASAALGLLQSGAGTSLAVLAKSSAGLTPQAPPPQVQPAGAQAPGQPQTGQPQAEQPQTDQAQSGQPQSAPQSGAAQ